MIDRKQTARWVGLVYGGPQTTGDLAEEYHDASKISPRQIGRQIEGARRLEASPHLQLSSTRAVRRLHRPAAELPVPRRPSAAALWETIERRRSQREFGAGPVGADELASLLHAGYGVTHVLDAPDRSASLPLRAVPSGGALYPLELYVASLRLDGLDAGLYHFDPLVHSLEILRTGVASDEVASLSTYPEIVAPCAALIVVVGVFGRTRFKYGLRGYRFALLEAGHVGQNVVLAATALGLAAVPLGGFYDRPLDEFLELDGVNESSLYTIAIGREPDGS